MNRPYPAVLPDHDALCRLALSDPQSFESLRTELIERCIDDAPEPIRLSLRRLQFRIDGIRRRSSSSLGAVVKINALMWQSFLAMNDGLQSLRSNQPARCRQPSPSARARGATVLELRPADGRR